MRSLITATTLGSLRPRRSRRLVPTHPGVMLLCAGLLLALASAAADPEQQLPTPEEFRTMTADDQNEALENIFTNEPTAKKVVDAMLLLLGGVKGTKLKIGDPIEARYKNGEKWYPATYEGEDYEDQLLDLGYGREYCMVKYDDTPNKKFPMLKERIRRSNDDFSCLWTVVKYTFVANSRLNLANIRHQIRNNGRIHDLDMPPRFTRKMLAVIKLLLTTAEEQGQLHQILKKRDIDDQNVFHHAHTLDQLRMLLSALDRVGLCATTRGSVRDGLQARSVPKDIEEHIIGFLPPACCLACATTRDSVRDGLQARGVPKDIEQHIIDFLPPACNLRYTVLNQPNKSADTPLMRHEAREDPDAVFRRISKVQLLIDAGADPTLRGPKLLDHARRCGASPAELKHLDLIMKSYCYKYRRNCRHVPPMPTTPGCNACRGTGSITIFVPTTQDRHEIQCPFCQGTGRSTSNPGPTGPEV